MSMDRQPANGPSDAWIMSGAVPPPEVQPPKAGDLSPALRERMVHAAREVLECHRVLHRGGLSIISEIMRGSPEGLLEFEHYPPDDVIDPEWRAQYYYHAHRGEDEHGHFHCFVRIPNPDSAGTVPVHLGAISMDAMGLPRALFATNRWVTDEYWLPAEDTMALLDRFVVDHAAPSWPVNRWISSMAILFRPHFEALLHHRDATLDAWRRHHPGRDALEDPALEITGQLPIDTKEWLAELFSQ